MIKTLVLCSFIEIFLLVKLVILDRGTIVVFSSRCQNVTDTGGPCNSRIFGEMKIRELQNREFQGPPVFGSKCPLKLY